jgi:hypothetical protein
MHVEADGEERNVEQSKVLKSHSLPTEFPKISWGQKFGHICVASDILQLRAWTMRLPMTTAGKFATRKVLLASHR